jgi:hypothetical protein
MGLLLNCKKAALPYIQLWHYKQAAVRTAWMFQPKSAGGLRMAQLERGVAFLCLLAC